MSMSVPEHCPGTESEAAGKVSTCQGCPNQAICSSGVTKVDPGAELVKERLKNVKHIILVVSGKGGVGKSTFTSLLARSLAAIDGNRNVAILDIDICGPSMPMVMGVQGELVHQSGSGYSPVFVDDNLCVMSVGFLLSSSDDAVIYRGPRKDAVIRKFLSEVDWGDSLEYMVIDTPPGTSDEHLSTATYLKGMSNVHAVVISTPQILSLIDVRKEIDFLNKVNIPILGAVENMAMYKCPECKAKAEIFRPNDGGVLQMANEFNIPYLGSIPLDPILARCCDDGVNPFQDYSDVPSLLAAKSIVEKIVAQLENS